MKIGSVLFILGLIAFGAVSCLDTAESVFTFQDDYLGAAGFPKLFGGILIALCAIELIRMLIASGGVADDDTRLTGRIYMAIAISCLYVLGFSYLGFIAATIPYLILMSLVFVHFDLTNIKGIIMYAVIVTLVTKGFFTVFRVYLPDTLLI